MVLEMYGHAEPSIATQVDPKLSIILAGYRHRFDRSINFKKLRWSANKMQSPPLCDACNALVPEVNDA